MKIYSQYLSILWKEFPAPLLRIKEAGYDGVECHLIGNMLKKENISWVIQETNRLGLDLWFHQGWSWETGQKIWPNWVLRFGGVLTPSHQPFEEQTQSVEMFPVVMYGNVARTTRKSNYLFQSIADCKSRKEVGYASSLQDFMDDVVTHNLPVVFDTQHILEWYYNVEYVTGLPNDADELLETLVTLWHNLKQHVKEIHLCDFDPELGPSSGRNLNLGKGIFPLNEFAEEVRHGKWNGIVTPEVQPAFLKGKGALDSLYLQTRHLFG